MDRAGEPWTHLFLEKYHDRARGRHFLGRLLRTNLNTDRPYNTATGPILLSEIWQLHNTALMDLSVMVLPRYVSLANHLTSRETIVNLSSSDVQAHSQKALGLRKLAAMYTSDGPCCSTNREATQAAATRAQGIATKLETLQQSARSATLVKDRSRDQALVRLCQV